MIQPFFEHKDILIEFGRYAVEAIILYILFKYGFKSRNNEIQLDEKTKEQLIADFEPWPLIDEEQSRISLPILAPFATSDNQESSIAYECADYDIFNFSGQNKTEIIEIIKKYGVGTCGPPGFYGTLDLHLDLEKKIAAMLGVESAILYSNNFTCINSVITCFCKHYDNIFYNEHCNEAIIRAISITKGASISWRNLEDLEFKIKQFYEPKKRNFIVSEGLFKNTGAIIDLVRLIDIKKKYKLRLILDESLSISMIDKRGLSGYYNTNIHQIDVIVGSLAHVFCGNGGFSAGTAYVTDHQRLSAQSYCFSASMPGYLAQNALCNISKDLDIAKARKLVKVFHKNFKSDNYLIISHIDSLMIVISNRTNLRIESPKPNNECASEMVKLRKIKLKLEQKGLRVGVIENPWPSLRINIKSNFKEQDVVKIAKAIYQELSIKN
ncbi:hypothetical protein EDEG_01971 [Edhazardia aedis USNM 41457]|uniref:serine C-palmitoyltransferase n=1 Tax=Edhazardia aedis (strain USNM 41457) TaxID=1003232 RepID=J8ZVP3_EDHAE|nr:hypothetical protein EDEG_01971 [Edhazardia aedis USNM 41457]|eukprot:EJW03733.1 hypothetical protein EDEG_01971 [Edhazardia aedis USNM 41457]